MSTTPVRFGRSSHDRTAAPVTGAARDAGAHRPDQGSLRYLWLVYLGFFFIKYAYQPPEGIELLSLAVTIPAFLWMYFTAFRATPGVVAVIIALMTLLAIAWTPFNPGASVLFVYAASFACRLGPPRTAITVVLLIAACAGLTAWFFNPRLEYWLPGVVISVIIGVANVLYTQGERRNAELRLTQAEVKRLARVAERERIARDLHDVLGHTLSLMAVKSELAARLIDRDPDRAAKEIGEVERTAREALTEVRRAISGLHEQTLDDALAQAEISLRAADIEAAIERDPELDLPHPTQAMLALVIREAVTNVLRHSGARRCRIRLARDDSDGVVLEIGDDGRGGVHADGTGIAGMRARIASLGGELLIESAAGTRLSARLPGGVPQS